MARFLSFIIIGALTIMFVMWIGQYYPNILKSDQNKISILSLVFIISLAGSNLVVRGAGLTTKLKQITGWLVILLMVITGYSYQLEIKDFSDRLAANVIPGYGKGNGDGSVTYYAAENGHFEVTALINDAARVHFLFDTGASTVSLTQEDAKSIGINTDALEYNIPINTANGTNWAARVMLNKIQVGPIVVTDVSSTVVKEGMDVSLLGMSFLRKLRQYDIKGNALTLRE